MATQHHIGLQLDGPPVELCLNSNETVEVSISKILLPVVAVLFQVHSYSTPPSVADIGLDMQQKFVTGSHIGFNYRLSPFEKGASALIRNPGTNISCFEASAVGITSSQPFPGGCAMDMSLPYVPAISHERSSDIPKVSLSWEPADRPIKERSSPPSTGTSCEDLKLENTTTYHIYGTFLEYSPKRNGSRDEIRDQIRLMQQVESTKNGAFKICSRKMSEPTQLSLAMWPAGYPLVLTILVENSSTHAAAPYVPTVAYNCLNEPCQAFVVPWQVYILLAWICLKGLFLCFFGHKNFAVSQFFIGTALGALACSSLVLYISTDSPSFEVILLRCIGFGLVVGVILLTFWEVCGSPLYSVFLAIFAMGYWASCISFYFLLDNWSVFRGSQSSHLLAFVLIELSTVAIFLYFVKHGHIIACAVIGASVTICSISVFVTGTLHYLLIRAAYRFAYWDYTEDMCFATPFFKRDLILSVMWAVLVVLGAGFQFWSTRKLVPPFPAVPSPIWKTIGGVFVYAGKKIKRCCCCRQSREDHEQLIEPNGAEEEDPNIPEINRRNVT